MIEFEYFLLLDLPSKPLQSKLVQFSGLGCLIKCCYAADKGHARGLGSCHLPPIQEIIGARNGAGPQILRHYSKPRTSPPPPVNPSLLVGAPMFERKKGLTTATTTVD